jgi:PAS domain S-box-containing protein
MNRLEKPDHGAIATTSPAWREVRVSTGTNLAAIVHDCGRRLESETTALRETLNALRESERRYWELFENGSDAIYVHDLSGRYTMVNQAGEDLIGYTRAEILRMSIFDVIPQDQFNKISEKLRKKLANHAPTIYELEAITKDGRRVPVEVSSRLIFENDVPVGVQGTVRDISVRRRAEAELRASEERFRELIENANDIIFTCDISGNFTSLNRAGQELTGYSNEEALKMNFAEVVPPGHIEKTREMLSRKAVADVATIYELEIITKSGERAELEVSSRTILDDGKPVGVQGVARDITERKRMQGALRASQVQLQQSQKLEAIGRLAGGIAHDFNNLLTAILGYSDLSLRHIDPQNPVAHHIEEVKKAAQRASSLTRQLLAFSRKQILEPKLLDLNHVIRDMNKLMNRLIGEDIEFDANLDPDIGGVMADPGQIEQVLLNLVVNARDAMPNGGRVTIETANIYLDDAYVRERPPMKPGHYVMLTITDNGMGIDAQTLTRIFEPFFTTKEVGKGTGLGLSTVYGIVKQSGGFVWAESELDLGTTFKVYLPKLTAPVEVEEPAVSHPAVVRGTGTVLLVEDDTTVRRMTAEFLELAGYKVLESGNGSGALAIAQSYESEIHLLVTDVVMPLMGGRELAEQLAKLCPGIRVLYISGYMDDAMVRHGIIDKDIAFLQKPFTAEGLVQKVYEVLQSTKN